MAKRRAWRERAPRPRRPRAPGSRRGQHATRDSLAAGSAALDASDAAAEAILRARAQRLAEPPADVAPAGQEVLVCRVAEERYALDLHFLRSVQPARELARVPCTPAYVAGAVNVRGEVVTVLDLGTALGLPSSATPIRSEVLLVEVAGNRVGLLVDEVVGIERLALEELDRAISGREFANGIAGGTTVYLNLAALLTDERLSVAEEVG